VIEKLRNIAIIAHVDHGKTTLVDKLLQQSGTLSDRGAPVERLMDSNDLEKERGITILAKNTSLRWRDYRINIVDTPGHADFGGEVERVLSMVDSVLLLVDAVDGPMPQTRFVTQKAFAMGFKPIVVINKVDRPGSRAHWVLDRTFDLFDRLGATDEQLDFPVIYASALHGYAGLDEEVRSGNMDPALRDHRCPCLSARSGPGRAVSITGQFPGLQQLCRCDWHWPHSPGQGQNQHPGGDSGSARQPPQWSRVANPRFSGHRAHRIPGGFRRRHHRLHWHRWLGISDVICDPNAIEPLPPLKVDEPTMSMTFQVNTSPFAGREGKFVTSRQVRERLQRELIHNVALRIEDSDDPDKFKVSGRGELHLSILIENMRREGYELAVSRPEVIVREIDGELCEPYEQLTVDVEEQHQGAIMEKLGERRGDLLDMQPDGKGRVRLDYLIPARGLIGFQTEFLTTTSGTGLIYHVFDRYGPVKKGAIGARLNGVLIANAPARCWPTPCSIFRSAGE
jgi:GTP-binding protein